MVADVQSTDSHMQNGQAEAIERQHVPCYFCGSWEHEPYDKENGFQLVRCLGCGLLYVHERPSDREISKGTRTGLHRGATELEMSGSFNPRILPRYLRVLHDFFPDGFPQGATWLDIGCGHGEFMIALEQYSQGGLTMEGCEPNEHKISSAKGRGLQVSDFDLGSHSKQYDYVSLLNVFSHLPDPVASLGSWMRLIKPGGCIFIETGHSSHLPPKHHHKPYYLPDHLSFANQDIVVQLLQRLGSREIRVRRYRHTVFPPFKIGQALRQAVKMGLGRPNTLRQYLPKEPNRDMFILGTILYSS